MAQLSHTYRAAACASFGRNISERRYSAPKVVDVRKLEFRFRVSVSVCLSVCLSIRLSLVIFVSCSLYLINFCAYLGDQLR